MPSANQKNSENAQAANEKFIHAPYYNPTNHVAAPMSLQDDAGGLSPAQQLVVALALSHTPRACLNEAGRVEPPLQQQFVSMTTNGTTGLCLDLDDGSLALLVPLRWCECK